MTPLRSRVLAGFAALLLFPFATCAAGFPDVPSNYAYATAINQLTVLGVIGGNPDGTFRPHNPVNRAAMLKMLYIAAKKTPEKLGACFSDVEQGSWYEFYVCDAAAKGYVQGYGGGLFKPGQAVTRAEAIKLTLAVFGIPAADLSADVLMYSDVHIGDWFAPYIHTALAQKILPVEGQSADTFAPNQILERGEAAAYVWNGLQVQPVAAQSSSSAVSSSSSSSTSSVSAEEQARAAGALQAAQQDQTSLELAQANTSSVSLPFSDTRTFSDKTPYSYTFTVTATVVTDITTTFADLSGGSVSCRLYHLGRSGFSQEYYLGFENGNTCTIRAAIAPGDWRLQLEPQHTGVTFTVVTKQVTGDNNDGFSQAATLPIMQVRTGALDANDLEDWYTFSVPKNDQTISDGGQNLVVHVTSMNSLGCLIYPLGDVDLYGFSGPVCETPYLFPPGTYMISVRHAPPYSVLQSYSIQITKPGK